MVENRMGGESEQRLLEAIRLGKQEAFGLLYDAYAPVLMGMISRMVPSSEVAEEVLKETFLAIWSRIHIFDPSKTRFLTWALALGRGIALEAQKTGLYGTLLHTNGTEERARQEEERRAKELEEARVKEAFCQLAPQEKAIIDLIYLKGYSCAQAAEALGISEQQLKSHLKLAFKHIGAERTA
ncbi:RNA polymerase sigma factor [Rufibacter glacialis]|uniref:RNA polymerase sigma factor n=1 Tax=Rufibacter glacialis TaxID=1259555 RepID=A0A5M8QC75_9BACT|nr:sigma-70 family RNA polymerase sigma factor [Rufibacter glacialis]KAA6432500.1 sigma-70 family RNA polymerase sigma factor [Rufibacter glacialis]GGK79204.1 ECF RNA polymerase sigma factor RpoE [Rufibacter glacialis]